MILPDEIHRPTDMELAKFLLQNDPRIPVLNIYDYEPWELPQFGLRTDKREWCFICPLQRRERTSRLTENGYWKVTGAERKVKDGQEEIGTKRFLVFHLGRTPNGESTEWKMHQYSAPLNILPNRQQGTFVLCKIIDKSNGNMQNNYEDELGNNMIVSDAYQIPDFSSFGYGHKHMTSENQATDASGFQQVDAELEPYPESFHGWIEQNPSFDPALEWEMQAEPRLNIVYDCCQFLSEPEADQYSL